MFTSPQPDEYEKVCVELGFTGVNRVMTLTSGSISVDLAVEPIGMNNPLCPVDATSLYDCMDDPAYNPCSHEEDVYIICSGSPADLPASLGKVC